MAGEEWRRRLVAEMEARGIGRTELTRAAGLNHTALRDIIDRGVTPRVDTLGKLARALNISLAYLLEGDVSSSLSVHVDGHAAGGDMWSEYAPGEALAVPLHLFEENTISISIGTDQFEPRFRRGDIVVGAKHFGEHLDNLIGTECIVQTADGKKLIRYLARGTTAGRFNLRSFDPREEDVQNARLAWAAPIGLIIRARH